jgi:hypothetical protein
MANATTQQHLVPVTRPEAKFGSEEDLRRFCTRSSERLELIALDVVLAAHQLEKALGEIPDGTGLGLISKVKAKLVVGHLKACAKVLDLSAGYCGGTWLAFCRLYAKERQGD